MADPPGELALEPDYNQSDNSNTNSEGEDDDERQNAKDEETKEKDRTGAETGSDHGSQQEQEPTVPSAAASKNEGVAAAAAAVVDTTGDKIYEERYCKPDEPKERENKTTTLFEAASKTSCIGVNPPKPVAKPKETAKETTKPIMDKTMTTKDAPETETETTVPTVGALSTITPGLAAAKTKTTPKITTTTATATTAPAPVLAPAPSPSPAPAPAPAPAPQKRRPSLTIAQLAAIKNIPVDSIPKIIPTPGHRSSSAAAAAAAAAAAQVRQESNRKPLKASSQSTSVSTISPPPPPPPTTLVPDSTVVAATVNGICALLQAYGPLTFRQLEFNLPPVVLNPCIESGSSSSSSSSSNSSSSSSSKNNNKDQSKDSHALKDILDLLVATNVVQIVQPASAVGLPLRYMMFNGVPRHETDVIMPACLLQQLEDAIDEIEASQRRVEELTRVWSQQKQAIRDAPSGRHVNSAPVRDCFKRLLAEHGDDITTDPVYFAALRNLHIDVAAVMDAAAAGSRGNNKETPTPTKKGKGKGKKKKRKAPSASAGCGIGGERTPTTGGSGNSAGNVGGQSSSTSKKKKKVSMGNIPTKLSALAQTQTKGQPQSGTTPALGSRTAAAVARAAAAQAAAAQAAQQQKHVQQQTVSIQSTVVRQQGSFDYEQARNT